MLESAIKYESTHPDPLVASAYLLEMAVYYEKHRPGRLSPGSGGGKELVGHVPTNLLKNIGTKEYILLLAVINMLFTCLCI